MFYIEIERANGTVFIYRVEDKVRRFETAQEADEVAETFWNSYAESEKYARFSVIDPDTGDSYSDWEC